MVTANLQWMNSIIDTELEVKISRLNDIKTKSTNSCLIGLCTRIEGLMLWTLVKRGLQLSKGSGKLPERAEQAKRCWIQQASEIELEEMSSHFIQLKNDSDLTESCMINLYEELEYEMIWEIVDRGIMAYEAEKLAS